MKSQPPLLRVVKLVAWALISGYCELAAAQYFSEAFETNDSSIIDPVSAVNFASLQDSDGTSQQPISNGAIAPTAPAPTGYDNGNDPTIVRKRLTFKSEYMRFKNGLAVNTTTVQSSFPILKEDDLNVNFGFDLPMNYYEVESPISAVLSGVGDMKAQLMGIKPLNKRVTLLAGSNLWLPTAEQQLLQLPNINDYTDVDLGTGKFRLEPLAGAVFFMSEKLFIIPLYAHDISFAGKPASSSINRGSARLFVNYNMAKGRYFSSETQCLINYNNDNDLDVFQKFEWGKAFKNGTVFYGKPGIGVAPDTFNREWGLELGMRFVF
jgi:hypothetical protein